MDIAKYGIAIDARSVKDAEKALDGMGAAGARAEKSIDGMAASAKVAGGILGAALAASAMVAAKSLFAAQIEADKLANTLKFATGANNLRAELDFTRKTAESLGLELVSSSQAYAKLAAAAKDTALEGKGARDIFTAVGKASTVMGLSAGEAQGALLAISQMISKGSVQAEELRGQLGERLPGAFQIASRAMGVTTSELGKMLEQGQVMSDDFLPKFAKELERTLGDQAGSAAMSAQSGLNKLNNEWTLFKQNLAGTEEWKNTSGWVLESTTNWVKNLRAAVEHGDWIDKLRWLTTGSVSQGATNAAAGKRFIGGIEQVVPEAPAKAAQYAEPQLSTQDRQLLEGLRTAQEKTAETRAALYQLLVQDKISTDEYNKRLAVLAEKDAKKSGAESRKAESDYKRKVEASQRFIESLDKEIAQFGQSESARKSYEAAQIANTLHAGKEREAFEASAKARTDTIAAQHAAVAADEKRTAAIDDLNARLNAQSMSESDAADVIEKAARQLDEQTFALTHNADEMREHNIVMMLQQSGLGATSDKYIELEKRIRSASDAFGDAKKSAAIADAAKKSADKAAKEWEKAADQIAQSLTDNIMRGGKSAGELLQDYFRTLVLRPIIQGVVQGGMNAVMGGSGGGIGGLLGAGQQGMSAYNMAGSLFGSGTVGGGAASYGGGMLGAAQLGYAGAATQNAAIAGMGFADLGATTVAGGVEAAAALQTTSSLGAGISSGLASIGPVGWAGLAAMAVMSSGILDDEGDAQRSGNWTAKLGERGSSTDNQWFGGMEAQDKQFADAVQKNEQAMIAALDLTTDQISQINSGLSGIAGKKYGFGMEHTDWLQSSADEQIVADRYQAIASALGMTVEQLGAEMALTNEALRASFDAAVLSDAEKLAVKTGAVRAEFEKLGQAMPGTIADYRDMVDATYAGGESTRQLYRDLLKLAPAMVDMTSATEKATQAAQQAAQQALNAAQQARDDALNAAQQAVSSAFDVLGKSVDAERDRLTASHDAQMELLNAQISAAEGLASRLEPLSSALHSALDNLRVEMAGGIVGRQVAQSQIKTAIVIARAGGAPDMRELQNSLSVLAKPSEGLFATFAEYQRDQAVTAIDISDLSKIADAQLTDAQRQTSVLRDQLSATSAGFAAENARLDGILSAAQAQIDAANGTTMAALSVEDAISALGYALSRLSTTSATVAAPAPPVAINAANPTGGSNIADLYRINLGREPDAAGLAYWSEQFGSSISAAEAQTFAIAAIPEYQSKLPGFATGINAGILPADQIIQTHGGERITPAVYVDQEKAARDETNALLARLLAENGMIRTEMAAMKTEMANTQRNTKRHADLFENVTEGGESMRSNVVESVPVPVA